VLPARAAADVSRFLDFEQHLAAASLTGANGLYLSVLVATLGLPASALLTRGLGVLTFVAGLVLAGPADRRSPPRDGGNGPDHPALPGLVDGRPSSPHPR
jgi:hypothetical protein